MVNTRYEIHRNKAEPCIYRYTTNNNTKWIIIGIFVDDVFMITSNQILHEHFVSAIQRRFVDVDDLGEIFRKHLVPR